MTRELPDVAGTATRQFLRSTLDALSAHIAVLDPRGTIVEVNRAWEDFAARNQARDGGIGLGVNYLQVCDGATGPFSEEAPRVAAAIRAVLAGEQRSFHLEYACHSPEERRFFEVRITPFAGEGPPRAVVAHENITARRLLEEEIVESRRMETVGRLAGGLAHELNSLLTSILLHSELMMADLPAGDGAARPNREIRKAAHQAAELVRQVLAYSRRQFLRPEPIELGKLLTRLEPMLRLLAGRNITLDVRALQPSPWVLADAGQLEQVLVQLATRARDAMPEGGWLEVKTQRRKVEPAEKPGVLPPGDYAVVEVADTGQALPPAVQERLFEPYFSPAGLAHHKGLGLASSYGIVRQSGGDLRVVSVPGHGSLFSIWLPEYRPA